MHTHATPCTLLGDTNGTYKFYLPNEFPTFADFNGDGSARSGVAVQHGRLGRLEQSERSSAVRIFAGLAGRAERDRQAGRFGPPMHYDKYEASPGVVTDLDGDGRAELTSEALKTSLTFDDEGQWGKQTPDSVHLPSDAIRNRSTATASSATSTATAPKTCCA